MGPKWVDIFRVINVYYGVEHLSKRHIARQLDE